MSGFSDKLAVADGVTIALNCGLCNQPADENHRCATVRYLRNPAVVYVRALADEDSNDPLDLFLVQSNYGEEYTVTRQVLKNSNYYEEI